MIICWLSEEEKTIKQKVVEYLIINYWLFDDQTNKHTKIVDYLIINCWLSDDHLAYISVIISISLSNHILTTWRKQANKQIQLILNNCWISGNLLIIYWSFDDPLLIIWNQSNKQTKQGYWISDNELSEDLIITKLMFCCHLLITKQTNKQTIMVDWMIISQSTIDYQVC